MRNSELPRRESLLASEEDSEPLPITPELIKELLDHIKDLWRQHGKAKSVDDGETQEILEIALHFAYHHLNALQGNIDHLTLPDWLAQDLDFELSFSCDHLHKVIKYLG